MFRCLELMEGFQQDFDDFQRALSEWYNKKYEKIRTKERYFSYVSLALSLAGRLIVAGSDLGSIKKTLAGFAMDRLVGFIPKKVKGYAVKLMVNVYDAGSHRLDRDRSYSIELMRSNQELMGDDVEHLLNAVRKKGTELPTVQSEKPADPISLGLAFDGRLFVTVESWKLTRPERERCLGSRLLHRSFTS